MDIRFTSEAHKDMIRLPLVMKYRLDSLLQRLENWPDVSGVKWLTGSLAGHGRIRMSDWRLIFRVDRVITIVRIQHRSQAYEA